MRRVVVVLAVGVALASGAPLLDAQTQAPSRPAAAPKSGSAPAPAAKSAERGPGRSNAPIVIDADRMEASKRDGLVIFTGNVVAKQESSVQTADRMEVYLDDKGDRVLRIVSTGAVKIVTEDCRTGTAKRAEYYDDDQRLVLIGDAKVWQDDNVVTGDEIELFLADDRSSVRSGTQGRVKSVFYPKRDEEKPGAGPAPPAGKKDAKRAPCG